MLSYVAHAVIIGLAAGRKKVEEKQALDELALLTPRQRQVFDCLVAGYATKKAAYELGLSPRTIEIHRGVIMRKLKAKSLANLTRLSCATPTLSVVHGGDKTGHWSVGDVLMRGGVKAGQWLEQIPADVGHCLYPAWRK